MKNEKEIWLKELNEFAQGDGAPVPPELFASLKKRLFPSPWLIFFKTLGLHVVVGFLSLAICNQFGLNPFQTSRSLSDWFMQTGGHNFCMLGCGIVFMATTYLLSNFFLTLEDLEAVRRYQWLQGSIIAFGSLAAFYFFGADLVFTFAVLWIIGAALGSFISIEGSYVIRRGWA